MITYNEYSINYEYRDILLKHFKDIGTLTNFDKDTLIEFEFKKLDYIYLIIDGIIKQSFLSTEGVEKILLILSSGDMFGEITMIQQDYDHVITRTYSNATICRIEKNVFYDRLKTNPSLYDSILLMVSTKFRVLMAQIHDNSYLDTKQRLLGLLKRLSVQWGPSKQLSHSIGLNLTHEELANMIGSTRSTVTRLMKTLESENKIHRDGRNIYLQD